MCTYVYIEIFCFNFFFYEFNVDALNLGGVGETQLTILRTSIKIDDFNHL